MKKLILATTMLAVAAPAVPVLAQSRHDVKDYRKDIRKAKKEYRKDVRRADSPREVRQARREYNRNVREARRDYRRDVRDWRRYRDYDWNRYEPGYNHYYADRYYRAGDYATRRLGYNDRIYRGRDGRYYCRRDDGTTGLIIGGIAGGILGNIIAPGDSDTIGTILGAAGGALAGRAIDRDNVRCR